MSLKSLETVAGQAENTARSLAGGAAAALRRETSITGWANRRLAGGAQKRPEAPRRRREGIYILPAEDLRKGREPEDRLFVAPDGYVRQSPVQELVVDPGYRRRLILRALLWAAGAAAAAAAAYMLFRLGVIAF